MRSYFKVLTIGILVFFATMFMSCTVKEKPKVYEKIYLAEDMSDVLKYISKINYKNMSIPTVEEFEKNPTLEENIWKSLVENTEYKRMPIGYEDDFNLRKLLSIEYTYNMYINGLKEISWDDECKFVLEFLLKRIFEKIGA